MAVLVLHMSGWWSVPLLDGQLGVGRRDGQPRGGGAVAVDPRLERHLLGIPAHHRLAMLCSVSCCVHCIMSGHIAQQCLLAWAVRNGTR